ncbi:MAG: PAS domain-containing protein [Planctomycetes bacterium]|nr:PAS domain-containing protein [Planctomycetota bacterium]
MKTSDSPLLGKLLGIRGDLLRGDSLLTLLIFVVVAAFLVNLVVSLWHNMHFQKDLREKAAIQSMQDVGSMLAKSSEALMMANEMSTLRRVVSEAALDHEFTSCSVTLPNVGILADADPGRITVLTLPATWPSADGEYAAVVAEDSIKLRYPLTIAGRGHATLSLTARLPHERGLGAGAHTTQMALACLSLATMLLVHRHARFRLKAVGAIHDALMAVKEGESDASSLELDPQLGSDAVAWNQLLGERQGQQVRAAIEQVQESISGKSQTTSELATVFDALPEGILLLDSELKINYANGAAGVLLRVDTQKLQGSEVTDYVTDHSVLDAICKAAASQKARAATVDVTCEEDSPSTVLRFSVRPVRPEATGDMVLVTISDITQKKVAEAAQNSFLTQASHELRSPLTNIQLYVEKAMEDCQDDPTGTARSLSVINRESRRLENIVSEILSISEIEAGSFTLRRDDVRLDIMLGQLKTEYLPKAREKQIAMTFDLPPKLPTLQADRDKICLALHNLVGNAVKYTPEQGRIKVQVGVDTADNELFVRVSDTGIGIPPDDVAKVFDKFYRAKDKRLAHITGSGLGLSIARELIRLHDGDIVVESELDKGSTFTITLPITREGHADGDQDRATMCSDLG